jgi:hypothetical protein
MADSKSSGNVENENPVYIPGMYNNKKSNLQGMFEELFNDWQQQRRMRESDSGKQYPVICFSRKIGVGALEIADILASRIGYHVIDREILEYLANRKGIDPRVAAFYDENCLREIEDTSANIFGVKIHPESEYSQLLFRAIFSFAMIGPAIFVGRGAHLILPRERVLAVRLICSDSFRSARIASMLNISESDAFSRLKQLDEEQQRFFLKVYGVKEDSPDEYDIIINRDFFKDPAQVAEIVKTVFVQRFSV